jgi:EAL domain-containing protein (putative c-di-GMP-specific phosphodiesterase class I)
MSVSIGAAVGPKDGATPQELLKNADLALYRAKDERRGRHVFFRREFQQALQSRLTLENELAAALARDEFELFYQPQINLSDGKLAGAEALIRWHHPRHGLVPPGEFMPLVNSLALSTKLGAWVLATACRQGAAWQRSGRQVRLGVNLSPSQLYSGDLAVQVAAVLEETGFSASSLELEVTEDIVISEEELAIQNFRQLQEFGVRLAFDDFGTGYAGLSYLKRFSLDVLKIDKSFVKGIRTSSDDRAIVAATITMSRDLGLSIIAEGIEDAESAEWLRQAGCDEGQGYLYSKPVPAAEFESRFLGSQSEALRAAHAA